jgi:hypothetical protein
MLFTIVHVAVAGPTRASGAVRQLIGICGVIAGLAVRASRLPARPMASLTSPHGCLTCTRARR